MNAYEPVDEFSGDAAVLARHYGELLGYMDDTRSDLQGERKQFIAGYEYARFQVELTTLHDLSRCECPDIGDDEYDYSGMPSPEESTDGWYCTECGADLQPTLDAVRGLVSRGESA